MNAIHRGKMVYSDKRIPHYVDHVEEATHRYLDQERRHWRYMSARSDREFLAWGMTWMNDRQPQAKRGGVWRDL